MNIEDLIKKYESLEGVWNANGAEIARHCFLRDLKQLNAIDTKKVTVPQYVADWIEECKNDDFHLFGAMEEMSLHQKKLDYWFREDDNMELFARAWLDGYEVEKEKKYIVKLKNVRDIFGILNFSKRSKEWRFSDSNTNNHHRTTHTRKELEDANFGWVFDCEGIEIEEVEG